MDGTLSNSSARECPMLTVSPWEGGQMYVGYLVGRGAAHLTICAITKELKFLKRQYCDHLIAISVLFVDGI